MKATGFAFGIAFCLLVNGVPSAVAADLKPNLRTLDPRR